MIDISKIQFGEDFVGRDIELQDLKRKIQNNGVVVLTGDRGIGKTNLMRVLEEFFKQYRECYYIESGSLFSTEISRYFMPDKVETGASHAMSVGGFGGGAGRSWSLREETILEGMEKSEDMIIFVENAHDLKKEDIQTILAGTGRNNKLKFILEIARPFYPDAGFKINPEQLFKLEILSTSDTRKIVIKDCPDFTEEVIIRIISLSKGNPYVARSLAYISEKKESEPDMLIFLNSLEDEDMEDTLNRIHHEVLDTLDDDAKELIGKLALAPPVLTLVLIEAFCGEDADTPLDEVIRRGILRKEGERFSIYHPLFRDYLQKSKRISHKNKKKIYSEAMENVKSELDSFYLLLEMLDEPDIFKELIKIIENFDVINFIGWKTYTWGKLDIAVLAWSSLYKKAINCGDKSVESIAINGMGLISRTRGDFQKALDYYVKALSIDEIIEDKSAMAYELGSMGVIYRRQGYWQKALEHYKKALKIYEEVGNKQGIADQFSNMGVICRIRSDTQKALEYHEKALKLYEEIGYKKGMGSQFGNMGNVYQIKGDMTKALEYHEKSLKIYDDIGYKGGIATDYGNIGIIYYTRRDMQKALQYFEKSLKLHEEIGNKLEMANQLGNIGAIYHIQRDLKKSQISFENALEFFKDVGDKPNEAQTLINIGSIFITKNNKSIALDYLLDAQDIAIDYAPHLFDKISGMVNKLLETQ